MNDKHIYIHEVMFLVTVHQVHPLTSELLFQDNLFFFIPCHTSAHAGPM